MTLKLTSLCPVACHKNQQDFAIPGPGSSVSQFVFAIEGNRRFYAIQPRNHAPNPDDEPDFNPLVAIIGLSPADTQLTDFVEEYRISASYDQAARSCCFKGLASDLILMLEATGAARQLGLTFIRRDSFNGHPDVLCDSLVRCASMTDAGDSTDWAPGNYEVAKTCVTRRFLPQILGLRFTRLRTVLILGDKGWAAINGLTTESGHTVHQALVDAGKRVLWFPHPSGQNGEYVALAKRQDFPSQEAFANSQYMKYVEKRKRSGKPMKKSEAEYKRKATSVWNGVASLRREFAS